MNQINILEVYRLGTAWVFDDPAHGLVQEPFVAGADEWFTIAAGLVNSPSKRCKIVFSAQPFPGSSVELHWLREQWGGNWYIAYGLGIQVEGWLCPALMHYFAQVPLTIYVQWEMLPE